MLVILDMTRAALGSEQLLVDRARRKYGGGVKYVAFGYSHHAASLPQDIEIRTLQSFDYEEVAAAISTFVGNIVGSGAADAVDVYTFHRAVFAIATAYAGAPVAVRVFPFATLRRPQSQDDRPLRAPSTGWPTDLMPVSEALATLARALLKFNATESNPLRQSQLRPILASEDVRFNETNHEAKIPGLLSRLIREAQEARLVETRRRAGDAANPLVWLNSDHPLAQTVAQSATPVEPGESAPSKTRSDQFLEILREREMGPFANVRETLYAALEEAVQAKGTVLDIVSRACEATRKHCGERPLGAKGPYPWRYVRIFLERLLRRDPVLRTDDGAGVIPSFGTMGTQVASISEDWQVKLDAQMVLTLVEADGAITIHDVPAITGALFNTRNRAKQRHVEAVIQYLLSIEAIEEVEGHLARKRTA